MRQFLPIPREHDRDIPAFPFWHGLCAVPVMEWLGPTLNTPDQLLKSMGGTVDGRPAATKPVADATTPADAKSSDSDSMWHVSFDDLLDVVNPLQHLPIVGTVYRALTHDQIKTPEKIAGDTLYGGVMGLASSVAAVVVPACSSRVVRTPRSRRSCGPVCRPRSAPYCPASSARKCRAT